MNSERNEMDKDLNEARLAAALEQSCSGADATPGELAALRAKLAQAGVPAAAPTPSTNKELESMSNPKPATLNVFAPRERESAFGLGGWITVAACLAAALLLAAGAGVFRKTSAPEANTVVPPKVPSVAGENESKKPEDATAQETTTGGKDAARRSSEAAHISSIEWLAKVQEKDGHFDSAKHGGLESQDVAVTALAAMAWLGAGHTPRTGRYKGNVKGACDWLVANPSADNTQAALRALALSEVHGMVATTYKDEAQAALDELAGRQCADGGWAMSANDKRDEGTWDPTVWAVFAIHTAKVSEFPVNPTVLERAAKALAAYTADPKRTSQSAYLGVAVANALIENWGVSLDGVAKANRYLVLNGRLDDPELAKLGIKTGAAKAAAPAWPKDGLSDEIVDWYRGTLLAFIQGGAAWKDWNTALRDALLPHQVQEGAEAGSWPVSESPGFKWGRTGATALATQSMEIYYRYTAIANWQRGTVKEKTVNQEKEDF
ncbi:MAG: hypothetical protein L6R28_16115 [Planctomycetes bacterium]|nr:hypothetical protein [Planctomycetota bacterium]